MRFRRIVTIDVAERDLAPEDWRAIAELGDEVVRCRAADADLEGRVHEADALIVQLGVPVTPALLDAAPRLRYVGVFGTSTGRIDEETSRRGIVVRNVPGFSTQAVAELAIGIVLDHLRDLSGARARAAHGDLDEPRSAGGELRGRRVGIVGLGAIGQRVAEIAGRGFGAEVRYWSRTRRPDDAPPFLALDALLAGSDVVTVHTALAPETRGLLDARRLALVAKGALLVHLAPLELLDLSALVERVGTGTLAFVTDHGDEASPSELACLRALPGCTLYPPIGYGTREAVAARRAGLIAALRNFVETSP